MWIVELDALAEIDDRLLFAALHAQEVPFRTFRGHEFRHYPEVLSGMTVPRGSCWFIARVAERSDWRGDLWGSPSDFDCTAYYPRYASRLLNREHRVLRLSEFCWLSEEVFGEFADEHGRVFVRPDSGFQPFKAKLLTREQLADWCEARVHTYVSGDTPVLVARPQVLGREWRCVVADGKILAAGAYGKDYESGAPRHVLDFVSGVLGEVEDPFRVSVIDAVETDVGLRIVEVGCALCCSWYEADYAPVVQELTRLTS